MKYRLRNKYGSLASVTSLNLAPVTVPTDYLGLHLHRYPNNPYGQPDSAPLFNYGTVRTHNNSCHWKDAHIANGSFDWTQHDAFINFHYTAGRSIIYNFFQTPTWAARTGMQSTLDPYEYLGGSAPPNSNTYASDFITALMTRYNTGGSKKIKYIEIWNEPIFNQVLTPNSFYWGSALDLVQTGNAVVNAAKAVDATIKILAPGFYDSSLLNTWLAQLDAVSGKKGVELVDAVGIHPYTMSYYGDSSYINGNATGPTMQRATAGIVAAGGSSSMPIHVTEYGISGAETDQAVVSFLAMQPSERKAIVCRLLLIGAIYGLASFCVYSYNSNLFGNLFTDVSGVIAGLNEFQNAIPGNTISSPIIDQFGRLSVVINGGRRIGW